MKTYSSILALLAAEQVLGGPVAANGKVSREAVVESVINSPFLLPPRSYSIFKSRFANDKSVPQDGPHGGEPAKPATLAETIKQYGYLIANLPGMIASGSTSPGKTAAPKSLVPAVQKLSSAQGEFPEAKRVKIRYGPYRVPPQSEENLEAQFWKIKGMSNALLWDAERPCEGNCMLLKATSDLEYADGSPANTSNGAWFHHTVLLNSGPSIKEPTCGEPYVESIMIVGNERTDGGYALKGSHIKSGYKVNPKDSFILQTELMNMEDTEKYVWQTITYEYLEGLQPDYKSGQTVYMTIGEASNPSVTKCSKTAKNPFGPTNMTIDALPLSMKFSEHSKVWNSLIDGRILKTAGHMHDGGTSIEIVQNDKVICDSVPKYSKDASAGMPGMDAGMGGKGGHSHGGRKNKRQVKAPGGYKNTDIEHIAGQNRCDYPDGIPLKKGDTMHIRANYDFNLHKGMINADGNLDEVMGIVGVLVAY
ncbi:hypothetical protein BT63DRAFT_415173 [Microthyrium microscopicum]|uniref:Uncharacterized protein n=1 Tax=Microthyrium microscopicum TaxID=703497 RepID=A0A6A6U942_9PEZI|nr:hypothetical protein BT63DRAFT_415173 [Microthyrium microscopicum]